MTSPRSARTSTSRATEAPRSAEPASPPGGAGALLGAPAPGRPVVPGARAGTDREERLVTVTVPLTPPWPDLEARLRDVLDRRWLTNQGRYADELTQRLRDHLATPSLSLVSSGTLAVELMIQSALPPGEVLVPSFSFPATWNLLCRDARWKPVFVDVGDDFCLDPEAAQAAITKDTVAILGVHTYGRPCHPVRLRELADAHGLRLLYDAAHAFGVEQAGAPLASAGDASAMSFHATKVFNTIEGGAVLCADPELGAAVDRERNFGFDGAEGQASFGTNAKLDEFRAAFGLAVLPLVPDAIRQRLAVATEYLERLAPLEERGVVLPRGLFENTAWTPNGAYFPVLFPAESGLDPAGVIAALRRVGVLARRYFDDRPFRSELYAPFLREADTPRAARFSREVVCLPIHHELAPEDVGLVIATLLGL